MGRVDGMSGDRNLPRKSPGKGVIGMGYPSTSSPISGMGGSVTPEGIVPEEGREERFGVEAEEVRKTLDF